MGLEWRALDLAGSYRAVFKEVLPKVILLADPFHLIKIANTRLDEASWIDSRYETLLLPVANGPRHRENPHLLMKLAMAKFEPLQSHALAAKVLTAGA